jgi:hypothetical protein
MYEMHGYEMRGHGMHGQRNAWLQVAHVSTTTDVVE